MSKSRVGRHVKKYYIMILVDVSTIHDIYEEKRKQKKKDTTTSG